MEGLELVVAGVEAHPLAVGGRVLAAVESREEHIELRIHLRLRFVVALDVIVALVGLLSRGVEVILVDETIFAARNGTLDPFDIQGLPLLDDRGVGGGDEDRRGSVFIIVDRVDALADDLFHRARVEGLAIKERVLAILLAVEIGGEVEDIVRGVLVHRGRRRRADENQRVGGIAHEDHAHAPEDDVHHAHGNTVLARPDPEPRRQTGEQQDSEPETVADEEHAADRHRDEEREADSARRTLAGDLTQSPDKDDQGREGVDQRAAVVGHRTTVDEEELEPLGHLDEARNEAVEHQHDDGERDEQSHERADEIHLETAVAEDEHDRRDTEQVQEMDRHADTDDIGYQDQITVGPGEVGAIFPLQYQPEDQRGAEAREGVDLTLDGREPERVAPCVGQGSDDTRTEDHQRLGQRQRGRLRIADDQPADKMGDGPEEKKNRQGREQAAHGVDRHGHILGRGCEVGEETRRQHEDGVARGVTHFEFVGLYDELAAVPVGRGRLQRQPVGEERYREDGPAYGVVEQVIAPVGQHGGNMHRFGVPAFKTFDRHFLRLVVGNTWEIPREIRRLRRHPEGCGKPIDMQNYK